MAKNNVFIGYDYDNDKAAWVGYQQGIRFLFYDRSFDVAVDSEEAIAIKQDLAARMGDASYFLCIVGKETTVAGWLGNPEGGRTQEEARGR